MIFLLTVNNKFKQQQICNNNELISSISWCFSYGPSLCPCAHHWNSIFCQTCLSKPKSINKIFFIEKAQTFMSLCRIFTPSFLGNGFKPSRSTSRLVRWIAISSVRLDLSLNDFTGNFLLLSFCCSLGSRRFSWIFNAFKFSIENSTIGR